MAKYQAEPNYVINGDKPIKFDYYGLYETDNATEIKKLDALCPTWIKCIEAPKPKKVPAKKTATKEA